MALSSSQFPKPATETPAGFDETCCLLADSPVQRLAQRRRRRELLEHYFSPLVSPAALPSAVDRLVLWRSRHARHRA
jgi:hypothetical protein